MMSRRSREAARTSTLGESLKVIQNAGERSADLPRQLLAFARKQTVSRRILDLNETIEGMTKMLCRLIGENVHLKWSPGECLWPVKMDPSQIDQILANPCVNARDAITDIGEIIIETATAVVDEKYCVEHMEFIAGEYVVLTVSDDGCGMSKEVRDRLFEPFFTTKEAGKGTGLGLATVYGAVKQNAGFINVYTEPGLGTTFKIYLPRYRDDDAPLQEKKNGLRNENTQGTILLVEDEQSILAMAAKMLRDLGYQVLAAGTPSRAVHIAEFYSGEINLLVTDVIMPEMNGRDLAKNIQTFRPGIGILFMSGYTADVIAHHGVLDDGVNFIQKPFSKTQPAAKVGETLGKR